MSLKTIFTLDARGNVLLETMREYFSFSDERMHVEINKFHSYLISILNEKLLKYENLKNCLIPKSDKNELALIFDTLQIENNWYGYEIFKKIIPSFDNESSHSVLCGDFIGDENFQQNLYFNFHLELKVKNDFVYKHSTQFFVVYINNLSNLQFNSLINNLHP